MNTLLIAWCGAAMVMFATWQVQRHTANAGWVDVSWAASMGLIGVTYAISGEAGLAHRVLLGLMVGLWSIRLTVHIAARVASGPEDARYASLRHWLGRRQSIGLLLFFQLQALAAAILSVPWLTAANSPASPHSAWLVLAVVTWLASFAGEWLADRQLADHRSDPANIGRTCRSGLWRYSRHPNYFFEWLHWWSYVPLCLAAPHWWLSLAGPLVMLLFLVFITGVPQTERRALQTRGEDYRYYQETTSPFFPWPPKQRSHENRN